MSARQRPRLTLGRRLAALTPAGPGTALIVGATGLSAENPLRTQVSRFQL
jgi:hypothetical protein